MPDQTPKTISELRAWYAAHQLPPEEVTRFFIGKDIQEPRAFGIYQDGDRFVVYKNKDNGSRAVRYHGPDEAYAVNELYLRLKQEIASQKARNAGEFAAEEQANHRYTAIALLIVAVVCAGIFVYSFWSIFNEPDRGYYRDHDSWYYYQNDAWYLFDDVWYLCNEKPSFAEDYRDYYVGSQYDNDYEFPDFALTEYYSTTDTSSTWSSSDSWDFGSTDWSSDW